jgi:hypothetical protein
MIEFAALPAAIRAVSVVGLVLLESIGLYLGYGALERRIGPPVLDAMRNA